ncbi:hypothetical protein GHK68_23460 [Sinorhizobium meliloti]|nr:hypothetical protein [Sinorhizobium meliloti]
MKVKPLIVSPLGAGLSHMADFEESNGEQNGIASRTNPSMFHACSAYAIPLPLGGEMAGRPEGVESQQALDHDIFRSGRPENMNVIDSKKLRPGMRAENRTHFSSSRSSAGV